MAIQWARWMRWAYPSLWNQQAGRQNSGPMSLVNEARQSITEERAMQVGAVFRCIRIIAETAAALPMRSYRKTPSGDLVPLADSDPVNGLIEEPNPTMSGDELRESMIGQMAGWGNGYTQKVIAPSDLQVKELWPYTVNNMQVDRAVDRTLSYIYPDANGAPRILTSDKVVHFRGFSLDGVMGLSPLSMARESLGLTVGAERYASSFYAQGGRPAHVLTSDKLLTQAQREQIRAEYGGMGGMPADLSELESQTGKRMWVLEGSLKYQAITVSPEDMQMLQTRSFQIADIARFFGVPLFLLMENSKDTSWGSGLEQMNLGFLAYTLRPYLTRMTRVWNRQIIPHFPGSKKCVDIDTQPLLALDSTALKELYGGYASNGIMTRNEIRRLLKLPAATDKNADKLTVQVALTPIEKLGTVQQPPPEPPPAPSGSQKDAINAEFEVIEVMTRDNLSAWDAINYVRAQRALR